MQLSIEDEIEKIIETPAIGETKKGDLQGFQIHKFAYIKQKLLIAYRVSKIEILFYIVGTHENFYRNLKKYLKEGN